MFQFTRQYLEAHGFTPYEVSNFAGRGGPCRHNDHYWLQGDYIGIGSSGDHTYMGFPTTVTGVAEIAVAHVQYAATA